MTPPLVCIVDDDQSMRRAVQRLFKSAGYSAEIFASAEDYLAREVFDGPSCLVLDVRMPGLNGLTGHGDVPTCKQAMRKGAVDFLVKPFDDEELLGAVQRALGRSEDYLRKRAERREARESINKLTPREFEVLRFVITGLLNKQIAAELQTAEKTIKVHRGRAMQKLGASSVPDLVRLAQRAGITPAIPSHPRKARASA